MRDTAILNTHPNVTTINAGTQAWDKDGNNVTLDESKITTEIARLQVEYNAKDYARKRQAEYPSIQECVHAILDDDLTALQEKRQAVKTKYPKS